MIAASETAAVMDSSVTPPAADDRLRLCVGIATRGRPQHASAAIARLGQQTFAPSGVIVACTGPQDVGDTAAHDTRILTTTPGLARQRNAILDALPAGTDVVVFFDDDFVAHPTWLQAVEAAFRADPALACLTGHVIRDGIKGPGLSEADAVEALAATAPDRHDWMIEGASPYGCNMAFRVPAIGSHRFDERLVLYGWLEDFDFGARIDGRRWRRAKLGRAIGVHLGAKGGRVSGRRLGYSQVMNPVYMLGKGTMSAGAAVRQIARNIGANILRSLRSEPYIDRRGRLHGNLIALGDVLVGLRTPERAERL